MMPFHSIPRWLIHLPIWALAGTIVAGEPALAAGAAAPRITAGSRHSVLLDDDGTLRAWGDGRLGQLGHGQFATADRPVAVVGPDGEGRLTSVVAVSAGLYHTLAIRGDGSVWAWGSNTFGQLGNGSWGHLEHSPVPVQVIGPGGRGHLKDVVAVSAGWDHSVALLSDGTVWAWGSRCHGQLGDGLRDSNNFSPHPVHVLGLDGKGMLSAVKALAWGIYLRHAEDVTLRNIRLVLVSSDARPPLVHENRTDEDLVIDGLSVDEAWR